VRPRLQVNRPGGDEIEPEIVTVRGDGLREQHRVAVIEAHAERHLRRSQAIGAQFRCGQDERQQVGRHVGVAAGEIHEGVAADATPGLEADARPGLRRGDAQRLPGDAGFVDVAALQRGEGQLCAAQEAGVNPVPDLRAVWRLGQGELGGERAGVRGGGHVEPQRVALPGGAEGVGLVMQRIAHSRRDVQAVGVPQQAHSVAVHLRPLPQPGPAQELALGVGLKDGHVFRPVGQIAIDDRRRVGQADGEGGAAGGLMHVGHIEQVVARPVDLKLEAHPLPFAQADIAPGADVAFARPRGGIVHGRAQHALAVLGFQQAVAGRAAGRPGIEHLHRQRLIGQGDQAHQALDG